MIKEFENLREEEIDVLLTAPVYVAILIAGADGNIDKSERKEAIDVAHSKQSRAREQLVDYYKLVGESFESKFNKLIDELPENAEERNKVLTAELRKLNFILPKMDKNFGVKLHASLKELAKKIAEASGGVLGYLSVSYEESKLIELQMIKEPGK
ncbi:MAG: hypothetical protein RIC30_11695 [Marinoscillum sp.]|uniref:hypothetical protein n=1 Tax=Marinoscillum sp. TaxID=2024838 RepID=UPI0032FA0ED3